MSLQISLSSHRRETNCNEKNNRTTGFLGTDLSWWGCEDRLQTERVAPAQHRSDEKEKVPGVGDWLPSDGKVSQECLETIWWCKYSALTFFVKVHACPFSGRTLPFIGSLKTAYLSFELMHLFPKRGWYPLMGHANIWLPWLAWSALLH
jgi:hypothetical protein